jgi:hypothetical protein
MTGKTINLQDFWKDNALQFNTFSIGLGWTKRHLDSSTLRRISSENYTVSEASITKSYKEFLGKQEVLYQARVLSAQAMTEARQKKEE